MDDDQVGQKIKVSEMRKWDKLGCKGDKRVSMKHFLASTFFPLWNNVIMSVASKNNNEKDQYPYEIKRRKQDAS